MKETILIAAVKLARAHGLRALTRDSVALMAEVAQGTVNYHFENMAGLRSAVVDYAIENAVIEVLAQARAERYPQLRRMSTELRTRVANHITG